MKKHLLVLTILVATATLAKAQTELAPDQNPNYTASRDKYMKMADSLTRWHSTTLQNTYEAIDWFADKEKAKNDRREFRQALRLERARWSGYDYRYNNNYNNSSYDYRNNGSYYSPYGNYPNRWQRSRNWWW